jgi:hypothetical protein
MTNSDVSFILVTFEAVHVLDPDPTDSLLNFKTLKKSITEPLFKEKLDKIYDPNEWFFKRKLTLKWISKRKLGKVRLFVIHDSFSDENIREFFDNVNEHYPNILAFLEVRNTISYGFRLRYCVYV